MGAGLREWEAHLSGEGGRPADHEGGGGRHQQARLLAQEQRAVGGAELGQLWVQAHRHRLEHWLLQAYCAAFRFTWQPHTGSTVYVTLLSIISISGS